MFDYRGLEALFTVQRLQGFEAAARELHITQSAVSQRIKALENQHGEPLLIRSVPYRATPLGEDLIRHYRQVMALEASLIQKNGSGQELMRVAVAVNRDSLDSWFYELLGYRDIFKSIQLEIIADDQELTLEYYKQGLVSACLSTNGNVVGGGRVDYLGTMDYLLVSAPDFAAHHFKRMRAEELVKAPALKYDDNDFLHERYLEKYFDLKGGQPLFHVIPSVRCFKRCILEGYGYGLVPKYDVVVELASGKLVQLFKSKIWSVPLYWHYWDVDLQAFREFNKKIIERSMCLLKI